MAKLTVKGTSGKILYLGDPVVYNQKGMTNWGCAQWIAWHKERVTQTNKEDANLIFLSYWEMLHPLDDSRWTCEFNSDFKSYFNSVGITNVSSWLSDASNILSRIPVSAAQSVLNVASTLENTTEAADNLAEGASSSADSIGNVGKYLPYILFAAATVFVAIVLYIIYKNQSIKVI